MQLCTIGSQNLELASTPSLKKNCSFFTIVGITTRVREKTLIAGIHKLLAHPKLRLEKASYVSAVSPCRRRHPACGHFSSGNLMGGQVPLGYVGALLFLLKHPSRVWAADFFTHACHWIIWIRRFSLVAEVSIPPYSQNMSCLAPNKFKTQGPNRF